MTNRMRSVASVAVCGLAIHGVITACGNIKSAAVDARAADALQAVDAPPTAETNIPSGTIVSFGGTTIPAGWALCDGSEVSRTTYSTLFAATGVHFGGGDGASTFNLPDLRGRFLRGVDGGAGQDPDAARRTSSKPGGATGDAVGTFEDYATARPRTQFTTDTQGSHTHANGDWNRLMRHTGMNTTTSNGDSTDGSGAEPDIGNAQPMLAAGAHSHFITGGGDADSRPRNVAVNYIIKL